MSSVVTVDQTEVSDCDELREAVQDAQVDILQLERGKMSGTITHVSVDTVGVSTGDFTQGLRSLGNLSDRRWALAAVLDASALWQHFEAMPGDLLILPPNHELYARYLTSNQYAAVFIEENELFAFLEGQPGALDAAVWRQSSALLTTDPATAAARTATLRLLLGALAKHGPAMSVGEVEDYKFRLLNLMTAPVIKSAGYRYRDPRLKQSSLELVRDVEHFLIETGTPPHIYELADHLGVSRQNLYRAFREVHGMPPGQFIDRKRLRDVHTALLTAAPGMETVEVIARQHGLIHLGGSAESTSHSSPSCRQRPCIGPRHPAGRSNEVNLEYKNQGR